MSVGETEGRSSFHLVSVPKFEGRRSCSKTHTTTIAAKGLPPCPANCKWNLLLLRRCTQSVFIDTHEKYGALAWSAYIRTETDQNNPFTHTHTPASSCTEPKAWPGTLMHKRAEWWDNDDADYLILALREPESQTGYRQWCKLDLRTT